MSTAAQIIGILLMGTGTVCLALTALGTQQFQTTPLAAMIIVGAGLYIGFRMRKVRR